MKSPYSEHVKTKMETVQSMLVDADYRCLVIGAGAVRTRFQDDLSYPFKVNPYFKEWLPLTKRPDCYLQIIAGDDRPKLLLRSEEDIWHTPPQTLPSAFEQEYDVFEYAKFDDIRSKTNIEKDSTAVIAETLPGQSSSANLNPKDVLNYLDFHRRFKTAYEQHCIRKANQFAYPAHVAAFDAFRAGASELDIAASYLAAADCSENDLPYPIIAGINENAAVLHHNRLNSQPVDRPLSFLIDAGIEVSGYASDITRTYAFNPDSEFAELIRIVDAKQLELVAAGGIGVSPIDLHRLSHRKIAEALVQFDLVNVSADAAVAAGLTETFYPHGLGHHLGCNVHDKGAQLATPQGECLEVTTEYPNMQNLSPMVANQVYTVEPGLYFMPALLQKLRGGEHKRMVNWSRVDALVPYGGIRIEDNVVLHPDGRLENLTRRGFESDGPSK